MKRLLLFVWLQGISAHMEIQGLHHGVVTEEVEPLTHIGKVHTPQFNVEDLPKIAGDLVSAFVRRFLAKESLAPGEETCLRHGAQAYVKDILQVASHVVMLAQELFGSRDEMPKLGHFGTTFESNFSTTLPIQQQHWMEEKHIFSERRLKVKDLVRDSSAVLIELGMAVQRVAALVHQIGHTCLQKDGVKLLEMAMEHTVNVTFVGESLLLNGADVVKEFADGAQKWHRGDRTGFGEDLGDAARKILFAKLPEGGVDMLVVPSSEKLVNISEAFLETFFGPGFTATFRTLKRGEPQNTFRVDLHSCFGKNADLVHKLWASVVAIYKSQEEKMKLRANHSSTKKAEHDVKQALTFDLMQVPAALAKCSLGPKKQEMLEDAYMGINGVDALSISLTAPNHGVTFRGDLFENSRMSPMGMLSEDLSNDGDGRELGRSIGRVCQEMALRAFPEKYTVDGFGRLRMREDSALAPFVIFLLALALSAAALTGALRRRSSTHATHSEMEPALAETV
ncbi:unnamed protein product [Symbiodinium pilosum]|uniref:Uncharacterized protein n=1 Tax=Symbiodinium pilosum TaxID=2952 RepID=A0A812XGB3_SYMPI|nr:unnamed protein product [Symbiodinium pilosum]